MTKLQIFVLLIELRPLEGSPLNPTEIAGAAVRCYIPAASSDQALQLLQESLIENDFELVEVEWCVNESEVEWENPNDKTAEEFILEARSSGDIVYGEFHVWGHEEG